MCDEWWSICRAESTNGNIIALLKPTSMKFAILCLALLGFVAKTLSDVIVSVEAGSNPVGVYFPGDSFPKTGSVYALT